MRFLTFLTRRRQAAEDVTVQAARAVRQSAAGGASLSAEPGFAGREPKGGQTRESATNRVTWRLELLG